LWTLPQNAQLKSLRKDPNVLNPGDIVTIPDLRSRTEDAAVDKCNVFVRKGTPAILRLQILDYEGKPRANVLCNISIDGDLSEQTTDGLGQLQIKIRPNAVEAVVLYDDSDGYSVRRTLQLGGVDPRSEKLGVRQRLANLGYCDLESDVTESGDTEASDTNDDSDDSDAEVDESSDSDAQTDDLAYAISDFQTSQGIEPTGTLDDETRQKLMDTHGC
jgi:N-acetylmuramoyl-L-alanine amidase